MTIKNIIFYLSIYGHLVPIFLGIYWFKTLNIYLKILLAVLVFHQVFEGISLLFIYLYQSNLVLVPFYNLIDLTAFTYILLLRLASKKIIRTIGIIDTIFILLVIMDEYFLHYSKIILHANSGIYACLVLMVLVLVMFYRFLLQITVDGITSKPDFWMGTGILIYSSFGILFYIYFQHFIKIDKEFLNFSITIRAIGNIMANALFLVTFYTQKNKPIERNIYY
ncbi:MAG: hypothetical protein K9G64_04830 [Bacteroidia bacterium]|nr:hypothetical protein [Bacteroidia bacterium]